MGRTVKLFTISKILNHPTPKSSSQFQPSYLYNVDDVLWSEILGHFFLGSWHSSIFVTFVISDVAKVLILKIHSETRFFGGGADGGEGKRSGGEEERLNE